MLIHCGLAVRGKAAPASPAVTAVNTKFVRRSPSFRLAFGNPLRGFTNPRHVTCNCGLHSGGAPLRRLENPIDKPTKCGYLLDLVFLQVVSGIGGTGRWSVRLEQTNARTIREKLSPPLKVL